ncbi:MAG: tyrosine-type recombinase/integrase [Lentisphaeria bacterium]|nr:tyrosine-type recombinase/integrase [Lentisphaeria bacterium]
MTKKYASSAQIRAWHGQDLTSAQHCGGGLYFRRNAGGSSSWLYRYTLNGRSRTLNLGRFPEKPYAQARKDALRAAADVGDGIDVAAIRRAEKEAALQERTVKALADDWYERNYAHRIDNPEPIRRRLDRHILPVMGKRYLDEVSPSDIDRCLRKVTKKYPATANNCLRDLKKMFRYAIKREWMSNNPAEHFDLSDAGGHQSPRERTLSEEELKTLFHEMRKSETFARQNELSVDLLLVLCPRKMELLASRWAEFDLDAGVWNMPNKEGRANAKNKKRAMRVPLPNQAIEWLRELEVFAAGSEYVFPARRITRQRRYQHVSPDTLNFALKDLGSKVPHFTVHDLRRTARTNLARLGVPPHVAEAAINHKPPKIQQVYDHYDYFDERAEALQRWADYLVGLMPT